MTSLFDQMPYLAAYHLSFLVLAGLALSHLVQSALIAPLAFVREEQSPGMPLRYDHSALGFRVSRTYSNSAETFPAFGWALLAAIVAGVAPAWVNGLAVGFFTFRMVFWAVYYGGIGKAAGGPRTLAFVGGMLCNTVLAVMAVWALL